MTQAELFEAILNTRVDLPDPDRPHTPGEYLGYIGLRATAAQQAIWTERSTEASRPAMLEIAALALAGLRENAVPFGLPTDDRAAILLSAASEVRVPAEPGFGDALLDIEGLVTRYKAHRPQLRAPEASPRVGMTLLEVLATAISALVEIT